MQEDGGKESGSIHGDCKKELLSGHVTIHAAHVQSENSTVLILPFSPINTVYSYDSKACCQCYDLALPAGSQIKSGKFTESFSWISFHLKNI